MNYNILTLGSATVDVFAYTDKRFFSKGEYHFPAGSKQLITELHIETGGGGTNTAVGFSKMGLKAAYIGLIGKDSTSHHILKELKDHGVDTQFTVQRQGNRPSYSVILDAKGHDRSILAFKGCANKLQWKQVKKVLDQVSTPWIYSSSLMEESYQTLKKVAQYASQNGIALACNPSSYMIRRYNVKEVLQHCTAVICNKEEGQQITGRKTKKAILRALTKMGPTTAVITDGNNLVWCSHEGEMWTAAPTPVELVETTGAGDAFSSGFVAARIKDATIPQALKIGIANAQSVVQHVGAKQQLLTWQQAKKQGEKFKIKKR